LSESDNLKLEHKKDRNKKHYQMNVWITVNVWAYNEKKKNNAMPKRY